MPPEKQPKNFNPRFPRGKRRGRLMADYFFKGISIHASRGGSDATISNASGLPIRFQSTLPAGEATLSAAAWAATRTYFNPRFPRGKRLNPWDTPLRLYHISIHASRGGSDLISYSSSIASKKFQSTLPAGEATTSFSDYANQPQDFNPRFPRGKRRRRIGQ